MSSLNQIEVTEGGIPVSIQNQLSPQKGTIEIKTISPEIMRKFYDALPEGKRFLIVGSHASKAIFGDEENAGYLNVGDIDLFVEDKETREIFVGLLSEYHEETIHAIGRLDGYDVEITDIHDYLGQYQDLISKILPYIQDNPTLKTMAELIFSSLGEGSFEGYIPTHGSTKRESIGVIFKKTNGEIETTVNNNWQEVEEDAYLDARDLELAKLRDPHENRLEYNPLSAKLFFLMSINDLVQKGVRLETGTNALFRSALEICGRVMLADCEANEWVNVTGYRNYIVYPFNALQVLLNEPDKFPFYTMNGYEKDVDILKSRFQKAFARAAYQDPAKALYYALSVWHLDKFIAPGLAEPIKVFNTAYVCSNFLVDLVLDDRLIKNEIDRIYFPEYREEAKKGVDRILKLFTLESDILGFRKFTQTDKELRNDLIKHPENMSIVFAMLIDSFELDPDIVIPELLNTWKMEGKLKGSWRKIGETDFDQGISESKILEAIAMIKKRKLEIVNQV